MSDFARSCPRSARTASTFTSASQGPPPGCRTHRSDPEHMTFGMPISLLNCGNCWRLRESDLAVKPSADERTARIAPARPSLSVELGGAAESHFAEAATDLGLRWVTPSCSTTSSSSMSTNVPNETSSWSVRLHDESSAVRTTSVACLIETTVATSSVALGAASNVSASGVGASRIPAASNTALSTNAPNGTSSSSSGSDSSDKTWMTCHFTVADGSDEVGLENLTGTRQGHPL
mmetsp:Transcript_45444/g.120528  ORF Transcript_45444/g.120528 Transcript_45444/m.120528 type:complete len:234 (+) Transcript_45444:418-1119(+)